jgi:hypothetical protein
MQFVRIVVELRPHIFAEPIRHCARPDRPDGQRERDVSGDREEPYTEDRELRIGYARNSYIAMLHVGQPVRCAGAVCGMVLGLTAETSE